MSSVIVAVAHTAAGWDLLEKMDDETYVHMARFVDAKQAARFCNITRIAGDPNRIVLLEIRLPQREIDLLDNFTALKREEFAKFKQEEGAE